MVQADARPGCVRPTGCPCPHDRLRPLRADADQRDRDARQFLQSSDVRSGSRGQVLDVPQVADVLAPAGQRFVHRLRVLEFVECERPAQRCAAHRVPDAESDLGQAREDVELVEHDAARGVDGDRVLQRHRVEPPAPPAAPGRRAEFAALLQEVAAGLLLQFGRERARPDTRGIGLHDADDLVDLERTDAAAGAGAARDRVTARDVGIRAVVEVEQRPLCALEEHVASLRERGLHEHRGVDDVVAQLIAPGHGLGDEIVQFERRQTVGFLQDGVAVRKHPAEFDPETRGVEEISMRTPMRQARSAYAGPIPRRVVPISSPASRASAARSSAT